MIPANIARTLEKALSALEDIEPCDDPAEEAQEEEEFGKAVEWLERSR